MLRPAFPVAVGLLIAGCTPAPSLSPTPQGVTSLYMPRAVRDAYRKGTRSSDGRPGPNYWQNRGRYNIAVTALPPDRSIRGLEQITYFNNSPDTLRNPVIKLLLNIHRPGAARSFGANADYLTPGVQIDSVAVNGVATPWTGNGPSANQRLRLPNPLLPRDSVRLTFKWHYEISKQSGREGMLDSTTYFLAYFYPRVAVFDDYNGWDQMEFTDVQEFYSDFNDYDVAITVPANYVVWGTGTLVNAAEVLSPTQVQRLNQSMTTDQVVNVASKREMAAKTVTAQASRNTWRFRATNIPDMTFNLSNHYVWDASSVVVDNATSRRASVQASYNDSAADFHHMVGFARHALDWLSHNWPGVPYPYEKTTIVQGQAGMEYPMMVNDESYPDTIFSRFVVEHEIAHTFFPFYMGINESRYAFMDEGWATTFEYLIGTADLGKDRADMFFKQFRTNGWAENPSPLEDLAIIIPADALSPNAYGDNAYGKAALGYLALKDLLGDAAFGAALHGFMDRWHGKHPIPWDFFNTVNNVTGRNLDWFWDSWFFRNGFIDVGVAGVDQRGEGYTVTIDNVGGMPVPVDAVLGFADGTNSVVHETPAIWAASQKRAVVVISSAKPVASIELRTGIWVDADSTNNRWARSR